MTDIDYTARQLLSTLWMRPNLFPVAAQVIERDDLLSGPPAIVWRIFREHIANGRLQLDKALATLDRHHAASEFMQQAQRENYYPHQYDEAQVRQWATELAEAGYRQIGVGLARRIGEQFEGERVPLDEAIQEGVTAFSTLRQGTGSTWRDQREIAVGSRAIREAWARGESAAAEPTGFYTLDRVLGGFRQGELSIIAARPSMGKTAKAVGIAVNIARRYQREGKGRVVAFFSAETSGELLQLRMAYALAGVDQTQSRTRRTTPEEERRVDDALALLESLPIYIDESASPTTDNMYIRAMALNNVVIDEQRRKVGIVFFDFVELAGDDDPNEEQRISGIARGLKRIAKGLSVPVVALSQLNRTADGRMPELRDLRYSGMLEQIAYAVLFIHRPSYYKKRSDPHYMPHADPEFRLAIVMVAKNKDGHTGPVREEFYEEFTLFRDPQDPENEEMRGHW